MKLLVKVANLMEILASYPYCEVVSSDAAYAPFIISNTSDPNFEAAKLVLSHVGEAEPDEATSKNSGHSTIEGRFTARSPPGISSTRWYAAMTLHYLTSLPSFLSSEATFTINPQLSYIRNKSSFSSIPSQVYDSSDIFQPIKFLGSSPAGRLLHKTTRSVVQQIADADVFRGFVASPALTSGLGHTPDTWELLRSSLISDGYGTAISYIIISILVHHIRRVLFPWLGSYMFLSPMEDLRLCRSRPDVFLAESLSFSWSWAVISPAQKLAFDAVGALAMQQAVGDSNQRVRRQDVASHAARIGALVWLLAAAEYAISRTVTTYTFLLAMLRPLVRGSEAERTVVAAEVWSHPLKLGLVVLPQTISYLLVGVLPLLRSAVASALLARRPALLLVILFLATGAWTMLRYRSKLYIAIELGNMFVVLWWAFVSAAFLATEFIHDPLGLAFSTDRAITRGILLEKSS
jgi:hypothetical protein